MHYYMKLGAPPDKLVLGLNAAAAGFVLQNASVNTVGAPINVGGIEGGSVLSAEGRRSYQGVRLHKLCNF